MSIYKQTQALDIQVLIIEDDIRIAEINRRFIEKIPGYQVVGIATDEQQAKDALEVLAPNLVLLDIYFPDMNGLELLRYIKQHYYHTDVIMITAAKEVDSLRDAIRNGVFDFIVKPVIFQRFEETMKKYQEFYSKINHLNEQKKQIDQAEIDQILRGTKGENVSYAPKGIDKLTLEKVLSFVKENNLGITADQLGRNLGVSRSTARRYLEYLVANGDASAELSYGTIGRPERMYRYSKN